MDSEYWIYTIVVLVVAAFLGLIPATIAKNKGYSFGLWWLYGWMLFIIAFIHSLFLFDKTQDKKDSNLSTQVEAQDVVEELKKYKELLDNDVLTEEEFNVKKAQLLKLISGGK